ncbi:hypothetical protein, partial [Kineosporia sp. A_224]|uniref:hypothetical protein n=1 Tax=Kineosporia sp. A_224 TaxID=1962180 RepID=UPI001E34135F
RRSGRGRAWRSENVRTVAVGAAVALGVGLAAIGDGYDYDAVCADTTTQTRVSDERCSTGGGAHGWYYVQAGSRAPAVGGRVGGGSFAAPDGGSYSVHRGGVSVQGGTVSRGGFGGRFATVGG